MTPKDKALELVDKFEISFAGIISNSEDWETLAKECALIAVDEIINDNPNIYDSDRLNYKYWNEVKQEINKLLCKQ